jgi:hypothetical protein
MNPQRVPALGGRRAREAEGFFLNKIIAPGAAPH